MKTTNLWRDKQGVLAVRAGATIVPTIAEAITLSREEERPVVFEFNGVTITVHGDSNPELIYRDWSRALSGYINKNVGPHPNSVLTNTEKESDARIEAENERERQARQTEYEKKARAHRERVDAKLVNASAIGLVDATRWQKFKNKNQDSYGGAVMSYAERWARLMQAEMASGKNLEDVADAASHEADVEGITGFMYGCAVSILAEVWIHGDRLRRWHNLKTQIGHEGEQANESGAVLNPALLSVRS